MKVNILGRKFEFKTEFVVITAAVLILLGCLAGYILFRDKSDIIIENGVAGVTTASMDQTGSAFGIASGIVSGKGLKDIAGASQTTDAVISGTAIKEAGQIKVYVVGCVNRPGIVTLEKGQVIDDAVTKAGGLTDEADAASINMVYELNENTMLYIKSKKQLEPNQNDAVKNLISKTSEKKSTGTQAKTEGADGSPGKGAEIVGGSGSSVEVTGGEESGNGAGGEENNGANSSININTADLAGLDKLPGVGEATAREIIAYREKNGPFRKIEDIMKVPRIKQGRFDSIKDLITVN